MSKLKGVQSCIIDAQYLAELIEIAADGIPQSILFRQCPGRPLLHRLRARRTLAAAVL